jgi:cysteine-rich CPCC protein
MSAQHRIPCPACGFLTLEGAYGSYVICDVCGWEDDHMQLANPASGGGANAESLIEAQAAALGRYPRDVEATAGVSRDPRWRPLSAEEKSSAQKDRTDEHWKREGIFEPRECYWITNPADPFGPWSTPRRQADQ